MKRILCLLVLLVVTAGSALTQVGSGSVEMSLSATGGWMKNKVEFSDGVTRENESEGYIVVSFQPGFYVTSFFQLEPELMMSAAKGSLPMYGVAGNLLLSVPPSQERTISPFVLAGYGVSNGIPVARQLLMRSSDKLDIKLLQAGGGLKIFVSPRVAIRAEYRFQKYTHDTEQTFTINGVRYVLGKLKITYTFNNIFIGMSIFLGGD